MQQSDSILLPVAPCRRGRLDEEGVLLAMEIMIVQSLFWAFPNLLWSTELSKHQASFLLIPQPRGFYDNVSSTLLIV